MSTMGEKVQAYIAEPDPKTEGEYRASWKRWKGVIPDHFLESLKVLAAEHGWRLEEK